ncbi:snake venom 5'-nucleotidase-like [Littorina saxatilis]|uniref:5'-nucleotidase n=1 Tax=Littorina saxatilis TaxID=31220 RepID=A0AAN9GFR3_9CAEN
MAVSPVGGFLKLCLVLWCFVVRCCCYDLTIMHTNDIHARYDQTNKYSGQCSDSDAQAGKCFGGFPRMKTKVKEIRAQNNNTVLVDAGDQYQGTIWFYRYGGNVSVSFMNMIKYDVMALGNHEFDQGPEGLRVLMDNAEFPIVSSNTDASAYSDIQQQLKKSTVLTIGGEKVGFVGYTTEDTKTISNPKEITFSDVVAALTSEVASLTSQGINKIVCVGHAGFVVDLRIAREVPGVDVVVGGHTNTFLYNGEAPSDEDPVGSYPVVIDRKDGTKALVVQDYAFGKYLGFLQVKFNDSGTVVSWSGNPILLNDSVPKDPALQTELDEWRKGVDEITKQVLGRTFVFLQGLKEQCRQQECSMGNLITDAMVTQNLRHSDSMEWNHVAIALLNGGGVRSSIPKGDITLADVLTVQPFRNTIDIVELNGSVIHDVMEFSASEWDPTELNGGFLQHSGLRVLYDMKQPKGQRVVEVKVRCADCEVPEFVDLEPTKVYKIIMSNFLANGGDGFTLIPKNTIKHHLIGDLDSTVLTSYITEYSPIIHGLEGRIRFVNVTSAVCKGETSGTTILLPTSLFTWLACCIVSSLVVVRNFVYPVH